MIIDEYMSEKDFANWLDRRESFYEERRIYNLAARIFPTYKQSRKGARKAVLQAERLCLANRYFTGAFIGDPS